jgi:hypothetical protein
MSVAIADIRAGLVTNLRTEFDGYQLNAYEMSSPQPPCFEIGFRLDRGIDFNLAMARGLDEYNLIVRGIVSFMLDIESQTLLDTWCAPTGDGSVRAAIEIDRTLGGVADNLVVTDMSNYRAFAVPSLPNVTFLAAEWAVIVYASGV